MFRKIGLGIGAAAIAAVIGCGLYFYLIPTKVPGIVIEAKPVTLEMRGPALLDANNKVTVTARIQGFMKSVNVDKNDPVSENQVLAQIYSEDVASQLAAAQADARAAELAVAETRANSESLRAIADKSRADYDRKRGLLTNATISQADWTATEAAFKQATADLARASIAIDRALAQKTSADANVESLRARLNDATIRSPLDGIVVQRYRNVGDLLSPGVVLMDIIDPKTVILTARLDESVMGAVRPGQSVTARFAAEQARQFKGSVWRLIRKVDQETREFEIHVTLDELPSTWALGQRATVTIEAVSPTATIAIPQDLIARRQGRVGVWKSADGRAEWVPVNLGYPSGKSIQIVSGLEPGDIVVQPKGRFDYQPLQVVTREQAAAR